MNNSSASDPKSQFLATLYLELAAKFVGDGAARHDEFLADKPNLAAKDQLSSKMCADPQCKKIHPQYPLSSEDLLKYVLKSAPKGSLPDLTGVIPSSKDLGNTIGKGGFSEVFTAKIKGKEVAIKLLKIDYGEVFHCKGRFVVRVRIPPII